MEKLIRKLFDLQYELTLLGAELDEKINRHACLPGIREMVRSESRNLILLAANIKYDSKVLKLSISRSSLSDENPQVDSLEAIDALNDIESLYYESFTRFGTLMEKLEDNPQNKPVEDLVRNAWARLGETYQQFQKIMLELELILSDQSTGEAFPKQIPEL